MSEEANEGGEDERVESAVRGAWSGGSTSTHCRRPQGVPDASPGRAWSAVRPKSVAGSLRARRVLRYLGSSGWRRDKGREGCCGASVSDISSLKLALVEWHSVCPTFATGACIGGVCADKPEKPAKPEARRGPLGVRGRGERRAEGGGTQHTPKRDNRDTTRREQPPPTHNRPGRN
eukprot:gene10977-19816_t